MPPNVRGNLPYMPSPRPLAEPLRRLTKLVRGKTPDVHSDWVSFSGPEHKALLKHLDASTVEQVREACSFAGAMYHSCRLNPISIKAIRERLVKVALATENLV